MSITIELTLEREARLLELFGSPTAAHVWLESIVIAATDHPVAKPDLVQKSPPARRSLGQQRGAVIYIAPDFDDPLPL